MTLLGESSLGLLFGVGSLAETRRSLRLVLRLFPEDNLLGVKTGSSLVSAKYGPVLLHYVVEGGEPPR